MGYYMERESSLGQMEPNTRENSKIMKSLAMADTIGLMGLFMKDTLLTVSDTAKEPIPILKKESFMKVNGKTV